MTNNHNPHSQIKKDKIPRLKQPDENDSEDTETNNTFAIHDFMSKILPDKEIAEGINPLNSEQVDVFNVVHIYHLKYNECDIEQVHTFISGN